MSASDAEVADAGVEAIRMFQGEGLLVKRSEHGASLVLADGSAVHVPAHPGPVIDVSGPGDTVVATFAVVHGRPAPTGKRRCAAPMRRRPSSSASRERRRFRSPNCARESCRTPRW